MNEKSLLIAQEEMQEIRYLYLVSDHSFTLHENICFYHKKDQTRFDRHELIQ